ncbi:MAG: MOSC domain-containing protein [Jatrophihabitans sp.]
MSATLTATVASLHVYPVKACGVTDLMTAEIEPRGFRGDRSFALIGADGEVITQRERPALARVRPTLRDGVLTLSGADRPEIQVIESADGKRVPVTVFGRPCHGIDQGANAAAWFAEVIGDDCRLVRCPDDVGKQVNPDYGDGEVAYADAYPVTVISTASLTGLNDRILEMGEDVVPMTRFRPNITVAGWTDPHAEDEVRRLRCGSVVLRLVKRDDRCVVTTVDQTTGEHTRQPLRALGKYRVIDQKIMFGMFAMVEQPGTVHAGDEVEVLD